MRYSSISKRGSTTAATPASSSPTRYDAQPRSSWVIWRKITAGSARSIWFAHGLVQNAGLAVLGIAGLRLRAALRGGRRAADALRGRGLRPACRHVPRRAVVVVPVPQDDSAGGVVRPPRCGARPGGLRAVRQADRFRLVL